MSVVRTNRSDPKFYLLMGPYFGSRKIERQTRDRFYDDPGKIWFVMEGGAASLLGSSIRNFWAEDEEHAKELLAAMLQDGTVQDGIVPRAYQDAFEAMGFVVAPHRKNFLEVRHEAD